MLRRSNFSFKKTISQRLTEQAHNKKINSKSISVEQNHNFFTWCRNSGSKGARYTLRRGINGQCCYLSSWETETLSLKDHKRWPGSYRSHVWQPCPRTCFFILSESFIITDNTHTHTYYIYIILTRQECCWWAEDLTWDLRCHPF